MFGWKRKAAIVTVLSAAVLNLVSVLIAIALGANIFAFTSEPAAAAPSIFSWDLVAPSPIARSEAQGVAVDGKLYVFGGFINKNLRTTARADAYDASTNTWSRIADMPVQLTHSAVVADGNTIYMLGGFIGNHPGPSTTRVLKYDIASNTWSDGIELPEERGAGAAAILGRELHFFAGAVRTAGQVDDTDHGDHWVLALDGGTEWQDRAPLPNPRNHLGAATLDGRIYAIGGQYAHSESTTAQVDVHAYDPGANSWTKVADIPVGRGHITSSALVQNGRIIVLGGSVNGGTAGKPSADVFSYDPQTNVWSKLTSLPEGRKTPVAGVFGDSIVVSTGASGGQNATSWVGTFPGSWEIGKSMPVSLGEVAGGIIGNKLYLVGEGSSATLYYNLSTGNWTRSGLATRPLVGHHHAAEVINDKLYLFGGLGNGAGKVQIYDPAANSWSLGADMPFAAGSSSTSVINGLVYVAGGIVGSSTTAQAAVYNPTTNSWALIAPMKQARNHAAAATDGSKLYVFGGRGPGSGDNNVVANGFDTVQIYDPATDSWVSSLDSGSTLAALPQARGGTGKAIFHDGKFYVFGGETKDGSGATLNSVYNRVDVYDPQTNTWSLAPDIPTARHGIFPMLHADRIYLAGGGIKAGFSSSNILEIYNPGATTSSPPPTGDGMPIPGRIEVEDYNVGGSGVGYHDTTAGNNGGAYRSDDVDIQTTTDNSGSFNVGWIDTGEWLAYDVNVADAGSYRITVRAATPNNGKSFHIEVDGTNITGTVNVPNTGGYQNWTDVVINNVQLTAGDYELRLVMGANQFNVNYMIFETADPAPSTPDAPSNLTADAFSDNQINLSWTDNADDETAYVVERSLNQADWTVLTDTLPAGSTSFSDTGLEPDTTYHYRVKATNAVGDSGYSNIASETTSSTGGGGGVPLPGRIEAEDYKAGGEGVGYHDTTPGNNGGQYRTDDVDIEVTGDSSGAFNVGWIEPGEWLAYDVDVAATGSYRITVRLASPANNKAFHIEVDGINVTGSQVIPNTGNFQNWTNVTINGIQLTAGAHEIRVVAETNRFNFNYVIVESSP